MRQLIAGNWKMHGLTEQAAAIAAPLRRAAYELPCDLLVCPPATILLTVAHVLVGSSVAVGGQDCHARPNGAHTGDISAAMLRDAGASFVITGHSERRADHTETDAMVRAKTEAAIAARLTPIVCVGETEAERAAGREAEIVAAQLAASLPARFAGVVAYEPVWAIGTGRTPDEADVAAMHAHIRAELRRLLGDAGAGLRILYGGSVKPGNAAALLALPEVGGARRADMGTANNAAALPGLTQPPGRGCAGPAPHRPAGDGIRCGYARAWPRHPSSVAVARCRSPTPAHRPPRREPWAVRLPWKLGGDHLDFRLAAVGLGLTDADDRREPGGDGRGRLLAPHHLIGLAVVGATLGMPGDHPAGAGVAQHGGGDVAGMRAARPGMAVLAADEDRRACEVLATVANMVAGGRPAGRSSARRLLRGTAHRRAWRPPARQPVHLSAVAGDQLAHGIFLPLPVIIPVAWYRMPHGSQTGPDWNRGPPRLHLGEDAGSQPPPLATGSPHACPVSPKPPKLLGRAPVLHDADRHRCGGSAMSPATWPATIARWHRRRPRHRQLPDVQDGYRRQLAQVTRMFGGKIDPTPHIRSGIAAQGRVEQLVTQAALNRRGRATWASALSDGGLAPDGSTICRFSRPGRQVDRARRVRHGAAQATRMTEARFMATGARGPDAAPAGCEPARAGIAAAGHRWFEQIYAFQQARRVADIVGPGVFRGHAARGADRARPVALVWRPQRRIHTEYRRIKAVVLSPGATVTRDMPVTDDEMKGVYAQRRADIRGPEKRSLRCSCCPTRRRREAVAAKWSAGEVISPR